MSFVRRGKRSIAPSHMRRTLTKTKETTKKLQTLCDDSNSPATDSKSAEKETNAKRNIMKSNRSSEYVSSSAEETNLLHKNKKTRLFPFSDSEDSQSSKEFTRTDKQKTNTRHKKVHSTVRKEKNKNKESECNDSEVEVLGKSIDKKEKRHTGSESVSRKFSSRFKEEADSSSGKEFQSTKLSRSSHIMKKLSEIKEDYTKSNSEATRCSGRKTINEKQCLRFKSRVTKILNKFKEVCSEYELQMESVKWKHLKKELMYQEVAKNIIDKSKDVISKLKMELDAQEKELVTFYSEWSHKSSLQNDDDSSSSETESLQVRNREEKSDESESKEILQKDSTVSDCDNDEIFSVSESEKTEVKKSKKSKNLTVEISSENPTDGDEGNVLPRTDYNVSPILGSNKTKKSLNETHSKKKLNTIDTSEENSTKLSSSENEQINDSLEDMFEEIIPESVEAADTSKLDQTELDEYSSSQATEVNNETEAVKCDSGKDENLLENEEQNTEPVNEDSSTEEVRSESLCSQETVQLKIHDTKSAKSIKTTQSEINFLDEEEKAKRALLESDSESLLNEESSSEKSNRISIDDNLQQNPLSQAETEHVEIEENKTKIESIHEDSSSDQQNEIDEMSTCAEQPSSDISTDNSARSSAVKKSIDKKRLESENDKDMIAKAKLLNSSNSESSNSDTNDEANAVKQLSRNKKCEKDSLEVSSANFDISVSERVKKRRVNIRKKYDIKSEEKLKMQCRVVLERLPEKSLKKYKAALSKSRQYLKDKEIDNLLDVDKLQKDFKTKNNSVQYASPKKKIKAGKEAEETLLDHLKKVENGECSQNIQDESGAENTDPVAKPQTNFPTKEELMMEADKAMKEILLNSDTDIDIQKNTSENSSSEKDKKFTKKKDKNKKLPIKSENEGSTSDKDGNEEDKSAWRRHKLLRKTLSSDSDTDVDKEKWDKKQKNVREKSEENNTQNSDAKGKSTKRKRRNFRKILDSDSDVQIATDPCSDSSLLETDQSSHSVSELKKTRKRKTRKSSNSDSSLPEKRGKQKRKRIKNLDTDSGSSSENDVTTNSQGTPGKKGRKNIRKVIKDKQVADDTKQAAKEEEERMRRIAERQKLYNEMYEARLADEEKVDKLVLDFDPETKEDLLSVHTGLVKRLKPHQAEGIKFMWDSCFESLERMKSSTGSGCIIAHCMGLGKTLQVISLIHTILSSEKIDIKTIMVVCPLSTVLNWVNEFKLWFKYVENGDDIEIYELTRLKKNIERKYQLESWQRTGGVLIIGYEMFRNLSGTNNKMRKSMKESVLEYLVDPGPDLIVCDEGHLLKNEDTALSKSMRRIKTLRRIVLTGTPLQNNLTEYHCMVQFVKPNLLGTKKEFLNRFVNPITNGQFDDSTEYDVKLMKKRAYVLHKMLKGCVQRFDYSVLTPFLPPKQEYVIFVRLTDVQIKTYRHYLENFARKQRTANGSLFADFQALQRIWTHPMVLKLNAEKMEKNNERRLSSSESEGSLKDFIDDSSDSESGTTSNSSASDDESGKSIQSVTENDKKRATRRNVTEAEVVPKLEETEKKEEEWWSQFTQPEDFEDMKVSAKLVLLFSILKECENIGDKVLVFSQSLYSLTLIEKFLEKIDNETQEGQLSEYTDGHSGSWSLGLDYFRLDGQTPPENRSIWCKIFNNPSNTRARLFLISTRAGGLGINLTAANRVIIFDASWNPSHDVQSIFRIYRFGQKKPCYVYRFLAAGTMEEKIYNRQVTKLSLACRVVDEQQIERHYSNNDLSELYNFDLYTEERGEKPTLNLPKDRLLAEIFLKYKDLVETYHEHDSLLENKAEEELDEEERKQAWLEYEEEKKGKRPMPSYQIMPTLSSNMLMSQYGLPPTIDVNTDYEKLKELIRKDYPNATPEQQQNLTARAIADMYSYFEQHTFHNTANLIYNQVPQNAALNIRPTMMPGVVATTMPTAMPPVTSHLRMQVPNFSRLANVLNVSNVNNQVRNERPFPVTDTNPKSGNVDDDIVEVSPTITNKSKNKEE